jgi:DNA-binding NarL/FixJ family response regulator
MNPIPQTRYLRNGDIYLAYQVFGEGALTLLFVSGFVSHLEIVWEEPALAAFLRRLGSMARVILFDKRGVGLSDRVGAPPTVAETMEDMVAILDDVGCDQAALMSVSEGGPMAILFAATYPRRTSHLILYGTMPKWERSYDYPWALSHRQYQQWLEEMIANWGTPVALRYFAPSQVDEPAFRAWWGKMLRMGATPGSVRDVLTALRAIDVRPVLEHVRVPSLVLHRRGDRAVSFRGGRFLAKQLANSRFVPLDGADHLWWVGDTETILREVERFLQDGTPGAADAAAPPEALTEREMDVLRLISAGYTNQQIADELVLTLGTVKTYASHIYDKLGVGNRTEAAAAARKQGLLR